MRQILKWIGLMVGGLFLGVIGLLIFSNTKANSALAAVFNDARIDIEQSMGQANVLVGERIVHIRNGCIDCHGADLGGKLVIDDPMMGHF